MPTLVLASKSPARLKTLTQAGIDPLVHVSDVDEDRVLAEYKNLGENLSPADIVLVLAKEKAEAVARELEDGEEDTGDLLVLGCDSMLELDGEMVGKPHDPATAKKRIAAQSGRWASLHTGHWLIDLRDDEHGGSRGASGAVSSTIIHFSHMDEEEIDAYIASGEPLEVAGAFTIDGLGGPFIDGIEGDPHGVIGLSLPLMRELLREFGVMVPQLWRPATDKMAQCHD